MKSEKATDVIFSKKRPAHMFAEEEYVLLDLDAEVAVEAAESELLQEIEQLKEKARWISVDERLPPPDEAVLTRCRNKNKPDGIWLYDMCHIDPDTNTWAKNRVYNYEVITHWKPIE